eukprot:2819043-Amphidinium_carterae.1
MLSCTLILLVSSRSHESTPTTILFTTLPRWKNGEATLLAKRLLLDNCGFLRRSFWKWCEVHHQQRCVKQGLIRAEHLMELVQSAGEESCVGCVLFLRRWGKQGLELFAVRGTHGNVLVVKPWRS